MRIIVSGVKGSGKTTVIQLVKKKFPEVKIFNFGNYIKKSIENKYPKLTRDQWDKNIPFKEHEKFQKMAAKYIAKEMKNSKYSIIDTNLLFKKPIGILPGLSEEVLKILKPDLIAIMDYRPEDVLERRLKDIKISKSEKTEIGTISSHRERDVETVKEIELEQTIQREFLITYTAMTGTILKIINLRFKENYEFEHTEIAAEEIIKILKD